MLKLEPTGAMIEHRQLRRKRLQHDPRTYMSPPPRGESESRHKLSKRTEPSLSWIEALSVATFFRDTCTKMIRAQKREFIKLGVS